MAEGVHRYNLLLVGPLGKRTDCNSWFCVCEVGPVLDVEVLARYCESVIDRIRASMRTDRWSKDVSIGCRGAVKENLTVSSSYRMCVPAHNHWPPLHWILTTPMHDDRVDA